MLCVLMVLVSACNKIEEKCDIDIIVEYELCNTTTIDYDNFTHINNITGINESGQTIYSGTKIFRCNPKEVPHKINCRNVTIKRF